MPDWHGDSQARLSAVKLADGTLVLMTYNAQGQRVGYSVSKNGLTSEAEQMTYRGDELAQAVISATPNATPILTSTTRPGHHWS